MKSLFAKARWNWLRLLLVVLLPLHAGFSQAAMSAAPASHAQAVAVIDDGALMADGMPCHQPSDSASQPDHSSPHKGGCCDAGSCHCVAACGLSFVIARIAPQAGFIGTPFACLCAPASARPPDLRPPIR